VTIGAAHATPAMTTAWRSVQRAILQFGRETGRERRAVEIARALAIATYRSAEEFDRRFPGGPRFTDAGPVFPCEEYIQSRGRDFADRFDAQTYHRLSLALDLHSATPENITVPVAVVAAEPDSIAPAALLRELAARLAGPSAFVAIPSIYGHDAFLKETETVGAILRAVLESPPRDVAACASVEVLR
jgi:homoserine O-acetyltransferase